uniref:Interleukin-6 n=1 Tax=Gouania willdenowi TaxID=441366 RepID=A0A8C5HMU4_GOUWI
GEEEGEVKTSDLLKTWKALADVAHLHKAQFEDEFKQDAIILESFKSPSFPVKCPESNLSKACFQRLAEGLMVYMVFLKHVEKEYPNNSLLSAAKSYSKVLIPLIKEHMTHSDQVTAPTSNQEEQLLKDYDKPADVFYRKMAAHGILHHLRKFLADGKRAIHKREKV